MYKFGDLPNYLLKICDFCAVIRFTENNFRKYVPVFGRLLPVLLLLPHLTPRSVLMRSTKKRQMFLFTVSTHLVTTDEYMTYPLL